MGHLPFVVFDDASPVLHKLLPSAFRKRAAGLTGVQVPYQYLASAGLAVARVDLDVELDFKLAITVQGFVPAPAPLCRVLAYVVDKTGFPARDYLSISALVWALSEHGKSLASIKDLYLLPADFVKTENSAMFGGPPSWFDELYIGHLADAQGGLSAYAFILWITWPYMLFTDRDN